MTFLRERDPNGSRFADGTESFKHVSLQRRDGTSMNAAPGRRGG